jgi:hypothetical protein
MLKNDLHFKYIVDKLKNSHFLRLVPMFDII